MSGFLYRGRHYNGNREAILKSKSQTKDLSSDETEKGPPLQSHSLREFEQHLNDLKKENFSLKLRIYFLEERIQQKFEDYSSKDVHKKNIELKVAVESLKQELQEKQQQFDKALATAEGVSDHNEAEVRRCCEERQQEISHIQEVLETKMKLLQEEANLARSEAEKMASLAASESQRCVDLERRMSAEAEVTEKNCSRQTQQEILAEKERLIQKLGESLCSREKEVASLNEEKSSLARKVAQLGKEVSVQQKGTDRKTEPDIGRSLKQLEMQKLIGEQQTQLVQYENAAGQCVTELQKAQQQVQALQTKIRESEAHNKKLQQRLADMDCELRSVREAAQGQERTIQTLSSSLNIKDNEVADLEQLFSEQKELLISLKQQNLRDELQQLRLTGAASGQLHTELLQLQTSLFSTQLELQSIQRVQRQAQRREDQLLRTNQRLLADFHGETRLRQEAEKHNQDLVAALQRARSDLEHMQEKWKEAVEEKNRVVEEREGRITELKTSLQHKEHLLHDYAELLDGKKEVGGNRDVLIHKLKLRIQDRDRALERSMDERFACVEQKEAEVRKLQLLLREKERDLQKLYGVLSNNEETITSLEVLLRGKSLELEQVNEAWKGSQRIQDERETQLACSLTERDALIGQLQTVLHTKETEELTSALVSKVPFGSRKVVEELKARLQLREQLFQKLLAEHNRQAQEHHAYVQELLNIGLSREQYIKDSAERTVQVVAEQTARLQELRRQVVSEQKRSQNTSELLEDAQQLQEELQLVLSKEREAQRELSILRSILASNQEQLHAQALQLSHELQISVECPASMEHVDISQADTGDSASGEEEDGDSEFADSGEEDEHCSATEQTLQSYEKHEGTILCPNPGSLEDQGLPEVRLLVEQKQAVERELWELKAQLEKAGFSSLSQMRKALLSLRSENEELKNSLKSRELELDGFRLLQDDVEKRPGEILSRPRVKHSTGAWFEPSEGKQDCIRPLSLDLGALLSCTTQLDLEQGKQQSQGLQTQISPARRFRELHTETSVQQDSKQVQVDLQDLGYETCGRSENELERDETSSPEFDDLELCTALSCREGASQWWSGPGPVNRAGGDVASLQQQVEDLQMQLSRSQALIHSLQACVQDPTPQKVDRADRELQELVTRVSSLEEQLRKGTGHDEKEEKSSTWPGKFDTLIQAQARELSHLRQRMREGRSACHILTQHLGDTTKAFEELLRANDIDYYMGQCFRDQLAQSSALAQRVGAKISSRDNSEVPDDKTGHELLAIRLSKELQQKDKLIESLRSKLEQQQARPDTPASNQALSEASDQSEHASFTMDEQASTNEDLELGSELDTVSNFGQEEATERSIADSHQSNAMIRPSNPPFLTSSRGHQSSSSCPSMHCIPQMRLEGYAQTGFTGSQFKPLSGFHLGSNPQNDLSDLHSRSQHAFQQSALGSLHGSPALKSGTEPLENRTLWNMAYGAQPRREGVYGDVSSCSSSYQSAAHQTGPDLMEEHLREIRSLRQRLEDSIQTNDRLRQQLEDRLGTMNKDAGAPTNIYIQGLDSVSKLSNEVQVLKEEKRTLQSQLQQASRDGLKEVEQLRQAVELERSRVKQAELEAEKWAGQFRQLQVQIGELKQDKQISQEKTNRLQHDVNILQQQLSESRRLVNLLQCELQAYQSVCGAAKSVNTELGSDLQEPQSHMRLLEQQLHDRLDHNMAHTSTRKKLFHDSSHSPPVRDTGFFNQTSSNFAEADNIQSSVKNLQNPSHEREEGEIPDGSYACRTGSHVVGRWDDFSILQQQLLEGKLIVHKMEAALQSRVEINLHEGCIKNILFGTKKLKQILEEVGSVLRMFWRSALPSVKAKTQQLQKEQSLQEEVVSLRNKLSQQEQTLRHTVETLRDSNRTKDSMEQFILSQLSRTRDVLKKARTNLEKNELRMSSLGCSFSPSFSQSFSSTSHWSFRGEASSSRGRSIMTVPAQCHDSGVCDSWAAQSFGTQYPVLFSGDALPAFSTVVPPLC